MAEITMCHVKGVAQGNEAQEKYHLLWDPCSLFFSSLFWFYSPWLYCFDSVSLLSKCCFCPQQAALLQWRNLSNLTEKYEHNTVEFTDTASTKHLNMVGHSAAKERDMSLASWWKISSKKRHIKFIFARYPEIKETLQIGMNVACVC